MEKKTFELSEYQVNSLAFILTDAIHERLNQCLDCDAAIDSELCFRERSVYYGVLSEASQMLYLLFSSYQAFVPDWRSHFSPSDLFELEFYSKFGKGKIDREILKRKK